MNEDRQIEVIVEALKTGKTIGVTVEDDPPEKVERYLSKIRTYLPTVIVEYKGPLIRGVTLLKLKIQNASGN